MSCAVPEQGVYCFTLDDNIRFLAESACAGYTSLFQHPYLRLFQRMHRKYDAKFQFNMFYSYAPGGFSLADAPECWRQELEANADWLRFSFHARHNAPPFPYEGAEPEVLIEDYREVMKQLVRIAGCAATDATTTIHYVAATKDACRALEAQGVRGLIGMFYDLPGKEALRYYLTPEQAAQCRESGLWADPETGLTFAKNDAVLNTLELEQILPALAGKTKRFYHVMIHEQYFYPDYPAWQPDFAQKVELPLELFRQRGLKSCFLEEII